MTRRSEQPDTQADLAIQECLKSKLPRSFVMVAGAGSGKTTSLVKTLQTIVALHGSQLRLRRQRTACITYTEIAASEIWADVGNNPLIHVSTIHSFLWMIVRNFQTDIRNWVGRRVQEKIEELEAAAAAFGPRVQQRTKDKNRRDIERYRGQANHIVNVKIFTYGTGSDYPNGILGHDDIIKMVSNMLVERPLFRRIVAQQFPFILVDESQDTMESVVQALTAIAGQKTSWACLGFFGDPMQQIYPTGIGTIPRDKDWLSITKAENFRCSASVLAVANSIRAKADGLIQVAGRVSAKVGNGVERGSAHFFVLPADDQRDQRLDRVCDWMARRTANPLWQSGAGGDVKRLVIVHRMAAKRLGFAKLYSSLNDKAPEAFKTGFLDASAWPMRPFVSFILPLSEAVSNGREFDTMVTLRRESPLLQRQALHGRDVAQVLTRLGATTHKLARMIEPGTTTSVRDALEFVRNEKLAILDPRLLVYLGEPAGGETISGEEEATEETSREIAAMDAYFECAASEFWGFQKYFALQSPFSTQQGIKGAEFPRVLVVLDDEEGTHVQFSYEKLFGIKPLSATDEENIRNGKETVVERTRRLFYVCCTRALTDLAVVLYSSDSAKAIKHVQESQIFQESAIHTVDDLAA